MCPCPQLCSTSFFRAPEKMRSKKISQKQSSLAFIFSLCLLPRSTTTPGLFFPVPPDPAKPKLTFSFSWVQSYWVGKSGFEPRLSRSWRKSPLPDGAPEELQSPALFQRSSAPHPLFNHTFPSPLRSSSDWSLWLCHGPVP